MDVSPLVDAALLLIFYFLFQSSFVIQPGVHVEFAEGEFTSGMAYGNLAVTVTREKLLLFNDEWIATLPDLGARLREAAETHPGEPLLIQADGEVPHFTVGKIFDLAREAGIQEAVIAHSIDRSTESESP
jgi:biopolymer transport protein ExbD